MKKVVLSLLLLTLFTGIIRAEDPVFDEITPENGLIKAKWSPFQFGFVPERYGQLIAGTANIYGLAIGVLVLEQESATVSVALTSGQRKNYGLQCAGVTITTLNYGLDIGAAANFVERNYGLQIGAVNVEADGRDRRKDLRSGAPGMQIGAFNIGQGFQIGVLNYNTNAYIPVLPIFNFSK